MQEVQKPIYFSEPFDEETPTNWQSYLPVAFAVGGAILIAGLRIQMGGERFIADGALMMLALACYLIAAAFQLTNLYAPSRMAQQIGLWTTTIGVFFNLASWLVRWVAAHDRELAILERNGHGEMPWVWRYIPFANLYDYSIAFAFGAGLTTLLIAHRKNYNFLGAFSLPVAALVLMLARFIGDEFIDLPPVLDSYWRPIHVGCASLSYGVALVCFAIAVAYLLKEGLKTEIMAIWTSIFALLIFATVSKFSVFTTGAYNASILLPLPNGRNMSTILRFELPFVGTALIVAGVLLVGVIGCFFAYLSQKDEKFRNIGHWLLKVAFVAQITGVLLYVWQVKSSTGIKWLLNEQINRDPAQLTVLGKWLLESEGFQAEQIAQIPANQIHNVGNDFFWQNSDTFFLSLKANPVEFSALVTGLAATMFVLIFSFRTEKLREALPSLQKLDNLMYVTASFAFAGLAILLITGAVWANESWGRYWGWDSKETGAFVAWLTYGAFLHTRISRGWSGRSSAYFAIVGFLLVIFTYLGVSYLLPGLHSYA
jgi:ABC-type transport system involved in cytochrome c biogenesis permease subunit